MEIIDDSGNIIIKIQGRLDTVASMKADKDINQALAGIGKVNSITVDASELTFISSSGLRIILTLKKKYPQFRIVEVQPDVYSVFEMTGFVKMMDVAKALRRRSVEGCPEIGRGGVGIVYRTAPDEIVKVFREGSSLEDVTKEISMAKEAFVLGMPTAISFDTVRVGNCYGLVYELLDATTMAKLISSTPERIPEYAVQFAKLAKELHSIEVAPGGVIPNGHANEEEAIRKIGRYFDDETINRLLDIVRCIPQGNRLLHCDLHPKNVMAQGNELMLIDMGEVSYGNPLIDLGHTYATMMGLIGDYNNVVGFDEELGHRFFDLFIHEYYCGETEETIRQNIEMIKVISYVRNMSWLSLSDCFPEDVVNECRAAYKERIADKLAYIINVCDKIRKTN